MHTALFHSKDSWGKFSVSSEGILQGESCFARAADEKSNQGLKTKNKLKEVA